MKITSELALKQSLCMTTDMRLAIDMLAMAAADLDQLIMEEFLNNPCLEENHHYIFESYPSADQLSSFDIAQNFTESSYDFREALKRQVRERHFNSIETAIALLLIDNLDDDGLLPDSPSVYQWIDDALGVFPEWIESVRLRLMDLDPIGCGAKNVGETIIYQAHNVCHFSHPEFFEVINSIARNPRAKFSPTHKTKIKKDKNISELKRLYPRPSRALEQKTEPKLTIVPDIMVAKQHQMLFVSLLKEPSKRWLTHKKSSMPFVKDYYKRASFLMRALKFRENSLLKVAKIIVNHQADWFLDKKPLKPLYLRDVAQLSGLHESSISRLTRDKFLFANGDVFELKYFFSQAIAGSNLAQAQSTSMLKERITSLVTKEPKSSPLSDQNICDLLKVQGIYIARRTVTKYREQLKIPPKSRRQAISLVP